MYFSVNIKYKTFLSGLSNSGKDPKCRINGDRKRELDVKTLLENAAQVTLSKGDSNTIHCIINQTNQQTNKGSRHQGHLGRMGTGEVSNTVVNSNHLGHWANGCGADCAKNIGCDNLSSKKHYQIKSLCCGTFCSNKVISCERDWVC